MREMLSDPNRIGILLQLLGAVLLSSGLMKRRRLSRIESKIRVYLIAGRQISRLRNYISQTIGPYIESARPLLLLAWTLIGIWVVAKYVVPKYLAPLWSYQWLIVQRVWSEGGFVFRLLLILGFLWDLLELLLFAAIIGWGGVLALYFWPLAIFAWAATYLSALFLYYVSLLPVLGGYLLTYVLLLPYKVMDRVAVFAKFSSVLSTSGSVLVMMGLLLQFLAW
jgi:hypothetical protein